MIQEIGQNNLNERYLFHGTRNENINKIAAEGFDMRVPTANGARFGKGIYFALNASYSIRFAKQCKMMFIARVLCGTSTLGKEHFTRPPVDVRTGRLFDSCLDSD